MINVTGLKVSYGQKDVLNIAAASFAAGRVHGIIGLNGAGKTTFFNVLAAFLKPDAGGILIDGRPLTSRDIGFFETDTYFYSGLTGAEYLRIFPATNARFDLTALNTLMRLPLDEVVESYSTGMKKKLALLAVIRQEKPVYIFDEPFNGLDLETNKAVELIIAALRAKGKTVFISSHILSPLKVVCDAVHLLRGGDFRASYEPEQFAAIEQDLFADFNATAARILVGAM